MSNQEESEPHADVVFLGGARVGKTALLHRLLQIEPSDALEGKYKPTIEDSFVREFLVDEQICRLRLVDTAGGYTFPAMQKLWIRRASAFILVCARNEPDSLNHLRMVMKQINEERKDETRKPPMVLAVNKCDLHMKHWIVSDDAVEALADECHIPYNTIVLTSAFIEMGLTKMLKCLWRQNEDAGPDAIQFELRGKRPRSDRRFSAFEVLFRSSNGANKAPVGRTKSQSRERQRGSLIDESPLPTPRRMTSTESSPGWLTKTFRKLSIGTKEKSNKGVPEIIDMQCNVS